MAHLMTDRDLLEALNLDHPGLQSVREALQAKDLESAKEQLVLYFRTCKDADPPPGSVDPEDRPQAISDTGEKLIGDLIERDPDWLSVADPGEIPERLYSTQVMTKNDHQQLVQLAQAYCESGNHKYARACFAAMLAWVESTGPLPLQPPTGEQAPPWRTVFYSTPRTENWSRCLFLLRDCPGLPVEDWIAVLKVVLHHLRYAANNDVPGMPNMVIHLFEKLIHLGRQWPEFAESESWFQKGINGLNTLLDDYFYADGAYIELSYFAHEVFVRIARRGQSGDLILPPDFQEKVERIFDFPAYMVKPNGAYPSVNDNYSAQDPAEIPATRGGLVEMGADFLAREDLRYINTFGREGTAPPWTSRAFPYGGFYIMRSDWSAAARYLVFDGGESAGGHNHVDKLSFELYAYGSTLVTDSGCGGPWASAWRSDYFVGPAGHNTIMVDGRGQVAGTPLFAIPSLAGRTSWREIAPEPLDNTWTTGAHFDYAASRYAAGYATYGSEQSRLRGFRYELNRVRTIEAMQPWTQTQAGPLQVKPHEHVFVDHERKVFFAKPDYWILSDRLLGRGRHKAESLFHFQASATAEIDKDGAVRTLNGAAGLTIMPHASSGLEARIVAGQHQPLQGWVPDGWGKHRPAPVAIFSTEAELPVTIDTVLFPYPRDEAPELRIERLDVAEQGALVEDWEASGLCIHNGQLRDYYLVAHERRALRRCGPLHTDAEVVMLRLSAAGTVVQLILVNGSYVEFENRPLVVAEHTFNTLELEWREDILDLRCHPRIGAVLEVGTARKLLINGAESSAISPTGGRLQIFENWLD